MIGSRLMLAFVDVSCRNLADTVLIPPPPSTPSVGEGPGPLGKRALDGAVCHPSRRVMA